MKSLCKVESVTNISKCYTETNLVSVDKFDCLSRDAQRLGKVSGGGLELGVLQPAVSTCFTFTSLLPKVGYFWIFYCKRYPNSRHAPLYSLNRKILSYILGRVAIIRVSRALKQTFFVVTCTHCLS